MSFIHAVGSAFNQYFSATGRASRSEYWWFALFTTVVMMVVSVVSGALLAITAPEASVETGRALVGLSASIALLVLLPPTVTVTVRRIHDIDMSGWWYLLAFVPLGGLVLFVFTLVAGTPRVNRYGPPPSPRAEYSPLGHGYVRADRARPRSDSSMFALIGLMFVGCSGIFILHAGVGEHTSRWSELDEMWLLLACVGLGFALVSLVWFTFAAVATAVGFVTRSALPRSS